MKKSIFLLCLLFLAIQQIYSSSPPPGTQAYNAFLHSQIDYSARVVCTRGDGDSIAVFAKLNGAGEAAPVAGVYYAPNSEFMQGDQIGTSGWYCVYRGIKRGISINGLSVSSTYRVHICEFSGSTLDYNVNSAVDNPINFDTKTCANPSDGGTIGAVQELCFGNSSYNSLSNQIEASGHAGTLEYKWQYYDEDQTMFQDISSSDNKDYSPSGLTKTTYFRRLARGTCYTNWDYAAYSNTVAIVFHEQFNAGKIGNKIKYAASGQNTSYKTDDDGDTKNGVPDPTNRFTNNDDGTITDNFTGLIWLQKADCALEETWSDAISLIEELNSSGTMWGNDCGDISNNGSHQTDWRMPNRNEYESLIDIEQKGLPDWLNSNGFIGVSNGIANSSTYPAQRYWTSNTFYDDDNDAWHAQLIEGRIRHWDKSISSAVWAVRGEANSGLIDVWKTGQTTKYGNGDDGDLEKGKTWPSPRFTDNGDGTVTDNLTHLMWLKNANVAQNVTSWESAFGYISELNSAGTILKNDAGDISNSGSHQTDWRLPNRKELISLLDIGNHSPALPEGHPFDSVVNLWYWTSSTFKRNTSNAWTVSLGSGSISHESKTSSSEYRYVWPVRDAYASDTGSIVCYAGDPEPISGGFPARGGANISYKWEVSSTGPTSGFSILTGENEASYDPPTGFIIEKWYRRYAKDNDCNTSFVLSDDVWKISVEDTAIAGELAKSPDIETITAGTSVAATLTNGTGGNGNEDLMYRTYNDTVWTEWEDYTSGNQIPTDSTITQIQIRTRRLADTCDSDETIVSWNIILGPPLPVAWWSVLIFAIALIAYFIIRRV